MATFYTRRNQSERNCMTLNHFGYVYYVYDPTHTNPKYP